MITNEYHLQVNNLFHCRNKSFIYFIFSRKYKICYVGQTANDLGPIARLVQHLKGADSGDADKGTFNKRLYDAIGFSFISVPDLEIYFHALPDQRIYWSAETTYRNAVEYLVQMNLLALVKRIPGVDDLPLMRFISKVSPTAAANELVIHEVAKNIVAKFVKVYNQNVPII